MAESRTGTDVHPDAHTLTVFRCLPDGTSRQYTGAYTPDDPWSGCEHWIRTLRKLGLIAKTEEDEYAQLDVLAENGDIVQDFPLTKKGFQYTYRKLHLRVERVPSDG